MFSRIERFITAIMVALVFAGVAFAVAQAQQPKVQPNQGETEQPCAVCHTEFVTTWQAGSHGTAGSDPVFLESWNTQGKPGACLVCHVTGYDPATATWTADGVTCEACHGEVSKDHPKEPATVDRSPDLCGRCHSDTRFGWQGWEGSTHYQRGMDCTVCHDPHSASLKNIPPEPGSNIKDASQLCINCHKEVSMNFPYSKHHEQGISCIDCHVEHMEQENRDPHSLPDHSFNASLKTCNTCHADQMHATGQAAIPQEDTSGEALAVEPTAIVAPEIQESSLTPEPSPVSPMGYAGLAGLVGLAAGMVLAPWLERFYLRVTKRHHHEEE
jgi:predicted CXXCH cytochrome family protein